MKKRYIRIDLEYDSDFLRAEYSFTVMNNLHRILKEDMPYLTIIHTSDSEQKDKLHK